MYFTKNFLLFILCFIAGFWKANPIINKKLLPPGPFIFLKCWFQKKTVLRFIWCVEWQLLNHSNILFIYAIQLLYSNPQAMISIQKPILGTSLLFYFQERIIVLDKQMEWICFKGMSALCYFLFTYFYIQLCLLDDVHIHSAFPHRTCIQIWPSIHIAHVPSTLCTQAKPMHKHTQFLCIGWSYPYPPSHPQKSCFLWQIDFSCRSCFLICHYHHSWGRQLTWGS